MRIHKSKDASIPIPSTSIFTHLHANDGHDPNHLAFVDATTGGRLTRAQFKALALSFAYGITHTLTTLGGPQLTRADTVLVFSPNSLAYPVVVHGLIAAGIRATLANSAYTARELQHQMHDSGAKAILVHPAFVGVAAECAGLMGWGEEEKKSRVVVMGYDVKEKGPAGLLQMEQLLGQGQLKEEEKFEGKLCEETALICYSSGTTGKPKGVETMHKNLVAEITIIKKYFDMTPSDVVIGVLPFYHIYGAVNFMFYSYQESAPVVIIPRFEPDLFCKAIQDHKVTTAMIVPPILVVLARHPCTEKYNLTSVRIFVSGAAPLGAPLVKAVKARLKGVGCEAVVVQGYGLTETSPASHFLPARDGMRKLGSVGVLFRNLEARLVNTTDGKDAKDGEPGELWIRGPIVMKGYWKNVQATESSITKDGFFKTGDIAVVDKEGYYYIVDRAKELIKYKGFQVPPAELESVLLQHPLIADAGVVGVDNVTEATEVPRAYVVHAKGLQGLKNAQEKVAFEKEVAGWIKAKVAKHKYLRGGVCVVDMIPKSAAGKILRRELRDRAKKEYAAETEQVRARL